MEPKKLLALGLSARAVRVIMSMEIQSVEDWLGISEKELLRKHGIGKRTVEEIIGFRDRIASGELDLQSPIQPASSAEAIEEADILYSKELLARLKDYSVDELRLSLRSRNALAAAYIVSLDQIAKLRDKDFNSIRNLGERSKEEIKRELDRWVNNNQFIILMTTKESEMPNDGGVPYKKLCEVLFDLIRLEPSVLYGLCKKSGINEYLESIEGFEYKQKDYAFLLESLAALQQAVLKFVKSIMDLGKEYLEADNFEVRMEKRIHDDEFREALIDYIKSKQILVRMDEMLVIKRKTLREEAECLEGNRKDLLIDRLEGLNLQEVGDKNGITRERARQVILKSAEKIPLVMEDYYSELFRQYRISKDAFYEIFPNADTWTYEFLSTRYKKGCTDIETVDPCKFNGLFAHAINAYLNEKKASKWKNGLSRTKIVWRILVFQSGGQYFSKESFKEAYKRFLQEHDLSEEKYSFNFNTINNKLRISSHVVFNKDGLFRYYENNASVFLNAINFERYKDSVISSELIFRDYRELMDECDIRDGYELFCLLKNSSNFDMRARQVVFRRIPSIIVGNGNEEEQVLKLLKEVAPIDHWKFYEAYEERYGVRKDSACANLGSYIEKYLHDGRYVIDLPTLSNEDGEVVRKVLSEKAFWTMAELEQVFLRIVGLSGSDALNVTTLYNLGFYLNTGYAYDRKYGSVFECLEENYFSHDLVDLNKIDYDVTRLSVFQSYVFRLREALDYVEISPRILASIAYLEKVYGITKEDIIGIQELSARYFVEKKYFNANSLWDLIKQDYRVRLLNNNKWLCTSILRQQAGVYSLSVTNSVILSLHKDDLNLAKICSWITDQEGRMSLEHLTDRFNSIFGSKIEKSKIAFKIKEQGDADMILLDGVDEYLEQIIASTVDSEEDDLLKEEFF